VGCCCSCEKDKAAAIRNSYYVIDPRYTTR
jgi:hypothetical protein